MGGNTKSNIFFSLIASVLKIFSSSFFSLNPPTGPIWTSSCNVHISVYMFIYPLAM